MMKQMTRITGVVTCVLLVAVGSARADKWDIDLSRLCQIKTKADRLLDGGGGYDAKVDQVADNGVVPDNASFRSLMSELGVVFAPNILSTSDTAGFGGFSFNAEVGFTKINPKRNAVDPRICYDANADARTCPGVNKNGFRYWRASKYVSNNAFDQADIRTVSPSTRRLEDELPPDWAPTVTIMARKGLWVPIPSFELGVGVRHLINSKMWAPVAQAKISLHEGFQGWPVPALAVRGSGARVMGSPDFNLTIIGLDFSISKHLGIASTFNLTPYTGYQLLWIVADSELLDATPAVNGMIQTRDYYANDPQMWTQCRMQDCHANFAFADQDNITRHRFFIGARVNFFIISLHVEYTFFASGAKSDQMYTMVAGNKVPLEIPDNAGTQHTISFSVGLDY